MTAVFQVKEQLKSEIIALVIEHNSRLRSLSRCRTAILPTAVVLSLAYGLLYWLVPDMGIVMVAGTAKKQIAPIICFILCALLLAILFRYILGLLLISLSSRDLTERTDEILSVGDNEILYTFRTRYVTDPDSRVVVVIPFRDITSVNYDRNIRKIQFAGRISSDVVEKFDPSRQYRPNSGNLKDLDIYDYFSPSLYEHLRKNELI